MANTGAQQLTPAELETLATMLNSSMHSMARATSAARLVWDAKPLNDTVIDMVEGYYDIQRTHAPASTRVYL
jgi:hypothetical protein